MTYVDGFIVAVPTANRDVYRAHAEKMVPLLREFGATRLMEGWGADVPRGEVNDLYGAVQATADETVLFSWIEYPDKPTRDAAGEKMMSDPRLQDMGDMPFDGKRMIYGGFGALHEAGDGGDCGFIDGVVIPVPEANRGDYQGFCERTAGVFRDAGATRVIDCWGDDVPDGQVTDFRRGAHAKDGEAVVFGWVEWPSKAVRDAGWETMMGDERMTGAAQPFDGKRMMFGGFEPLLDVQTGA